MKRSLGRLTVGLRREDPTRVWERRSALSPREVGKLVKDHGAKVVVQDCQRRVWTSEEYEREGAEIVPSLGSSNCHIILGIKETPLPEVFPDTVTPDGTPLTHLMFSHTVKGQSYNMPLLSKFVHPMPGKRKEDLPRLIDYELLTDGSGKRTVGFGWYAGVAGVLESLSSMAHSHLEMGIATPFLYTPRPHTLPSVDALRAALRNVGHMITEQGTKALGPVVFGVTGTGKVAQGCLSILKELPIVTLNSPEELAALVTNPDADTRKVYLFHAKPQDYLVRLDGKPYDREHYYRFPESYTSKFATTIYPYLTLLLNGVGWAPNFPRLMTNENLGVALDMAQSIDGGKGKRGLNVGDISCDVEGGLEFLTKATTLSDPFYKTRPDTLPKRLPPVQIMSVDILPTAIPRDASEAFSSGIYPYLEALIAWRQLGHSPNAKVRNVLSSLPEGHLDALKGLEKATIAAGGKLTERHEWLSDRVNTVNSSKDEPAKEGQPLVPTNTKRKKVLLLGSGMVAGPAVDVLSKRSDVELIIATNSQLEAQNLARDHLNVNYRIIDMNNTSTVEGLVQEADVAISLLPVALHLQVADLCVKHKTHMVTASYISPDMRKLHDKALRADVLLLNEIGLDPGLDHCSAIKLVNEIEAKGERVESFTSFCGGLPAPEAANGPLKYKFSWSPMGVLLASLNAAKFKLSGKVVGIEGINLLKKPFTGLPIVQRGQFEALANRDSLPYADMYGLSLRDLRTCFRGTLRYPGFSKLLDAFKKLGLLNKAWTISPSSWAELVPLALAAHLGHGNDVRSAASTIASILSPSEADEVLQAMTWLNLISSTEHAPWRSKDVTMPPLPKEPQTPIALLSILLAHKLKYQPGERDMVVLSHEIISRSADARQEYVYESTLVAYGNEKGTAMAQTVGIPVALAALKVLDGGVVGRGVMAPTEPAIYNSVLSGMAERGLEMKEKRTSMVDIMRDVTKRRTERSQELPTMETDGVQEGRKPEWEHATVEHALEAAHFGKHASIQRATREKGNRALAN